MPTKRNQGGTKTVTEEYLEPGAGGDPRVSQKVIRARRNAKGDKHANGDRKGVKKWGVEKGRQGSIRVRSQGEGRKD